MSAEVLELTSTILRVKDDLSSEKGADTINLTSTISRVKDDMGSSIIMTVNLISYIFFEDV